MLHAASSGEKTYELMKSIFKKGESVPDAILLPQGSARALIVRAIRECGLKIPEDVSIVTTEALNAPEGNGPEGHSTVVYEPALPLSRLLMEMLFERITQKGAPLPGKFLPS